MALRGKIEVVFELKSTPEQFYDVWKKEPYQIPNHTPNNIQDVNPHEHDWDSHGHGYIKVWKYTFGYSKGQRELVKYVLEYEALNENIPPPYNYFDLIINVMKDIDKGFAKA